jgi:hypothetical protein
MPFTRFRQAPDVSFGDRSIVLSPVESVCSALSRRSTRFGAPLAPLQGVFSPAMVAIEQRTSDAPVTHPTNDDAQGLDQERAAANWAKVACPAPS